MGEFFQSAETLFQDNDQSIALISLHGQGRRVVNHSSDTTYKVIGGCGTFEIDGDEMYVEDGHTFTIESGSVYEDFGVMLVMLATSEPPYDPSQVEILDEPKRVML